MTSTVSRVLASPSSLMIVALLLTSFVCGSQAVRCAVSQDRHVKLQENTHTAGSDDHSHEGGELLIWAKEPFAPDQDYGHCITAHLHINENYDEHEHDGFHIESVFGTVSVGSSGTCPGSDTERTELMDKVKQMLSTALDPQAVERNVDVRQPGYDPGQYETGRQERLFMENIKCCDSDDTCYDPNSWVARTPMHNEHSEHNEASSTVASKVFVMACVAVVFLMKMMM
ncbi:hypothetical protein DUNSADRAFT_365 [Dunaliella salina]|uniref:Uncharacterized protein n=1 Tax=Dunaliella salina TaxID=3046 RepID=A0ABQ7FZ17_DUNSA|nr:hypothetical protein DUNSADRAFT_365 [Dunaliella salina]|eukprot:KAF5827598.1 hypothetical protein DUNSADRAFT_365 [Dunaliella salina]